MRYISVDLPDDFTGVSVATDDHLPTPCHLGRSPVGAGNVITLATTDNTAANALGANGWVRFEITATTSITAHTPNNDANRFITNVFSRNIGTTGDTATYKVGVWVQNSPITLPTATPRLSSNGTRRR